MPYADSYRSRLQFLLAAKHSHTIEKQTVRGPMDFDDHGIVLPPDADRRVVQRISGSGVPMTDVILNSFQPEANHPNGGFYGARACGGNFRRLLEMHPVYVDPAASLLGAYMVNFMSYRQAHWNPDFEYADLAERQRECGVIGAVGGVQHFCPDFAIGLELGFGGLLEKIARYRPVNAAQEFYDGLEAVVRGLQNWIRRHAAAARELAARHPGIADNLLEMAAMNERLATEAPATFREACQWILWFELAARMYNGSAAVGRLDVLLAPYYREGEPGDEEAIFHIANLLLRDTAYLQLGGPGRDGADVTNRLSYLILEAAHRMKIPVNIGVPIGRTVDPGLARRGVEILIEDRCGHPKFLGVDNTIAGAVRNGFTPEAARERAYCGCHWSGLPGREYALMDLIKINLAKLFDLALREMAADAAARPSAAGLWERFRRSLRAAIGIVAEGIDFHIAHMHAVYPELVLDLLCHGPLEKGLDASQGSLEYNTFGVDGAGLATAADSFAAVEWCLAGEAGFSWDELLGYLDTDWSTPAGERARRRIRGRERFGAGASAGDRWAKDIAAEFAAQVHARPTPAGYRMTPGLFSWSLTVLMGKDLAATPNGRRAGEPISHGANPDPGFRGDGAPTALAVAVALVQPGYGNTAPLQLDLDPCLANTPEDTDAILALLRGHCELGGTQININVLDRDRLLAAQRNPGLYPDLVVRVTGFSAYFASLSPEFRQLVVDRIIRER